MRRRHLVTGAVIVMLAVVTVLLVALALRPVEPPASSPSLEIGALAASGDTVWRWVGPSDCNADALALPLERSEGGGAWRPAPIPLANVYALSFTDASRGVATGTTSACSRGVALTNDGGKTWANREDNPVLLDAWYEGNRIWGIEQTIGEPQISVYRVDADLRLVPVPGAKPDQPCDAADGEPQHLAFWNDTTGLLLCQNAVTGSRLLARTTNAGEVFERLTDDRPELGLDGAETVLDLDVTGTRTAYVLFGPGGECSEGQLRESENEGASFRRLDCPSASVEVDRVLDVGFTSQQDAVLLGLRNREPVLLASSDGGDTWIER